jgi:hypothetical protein
MIGRSRCLGSLALVLLAWNASFQAAPVSAASPEGHMTWGVHISLAPTWFDPAETPGIGTPFIHEKAMYAPIWELGFIHAQGPRVAESSLGLITGWAFSAPYEDVKLKGR